MKRDKDEQRREIDRLAPELARSGRFKGWYDIEVHLRLKEGLPEARNWLNNATTRRYLNQLCREAQKDSRKRHD